MATDVFCADHLHEGLSGGSLRRALEVLSEAACATVVLFDTDGRALIGPVAGSPFVRELLTTQAGRELLVDAHRQAIEGLEPAVCHLDRFALPLIRGRRRVGTLTIGDRPRKPLPSDAVEVMALAAGVSIEALQQPAAELPPWSAGEAAAFRNLAALTGDMLVSLCSQDEDLRHRIEELSAVYNIAGLFAGELDLQEILDKTTRMVAEVMKIKACSIRMLDATTGALTIKAVHNLSPEYISKGPVTVDQNPIDRTALGGELVRIADSATDPRVRYPEQARREGLVSGLVCGMVYRGKAVGVIRVYTGEPHAFSPYEESLLQAVASQAAAAIINARLVAETLEAERYARQLAYAGDVQRRMIPAEPPAHPKVEIGAVYRPTFEVGGDFYDLITLPEGNLGIGIADVSGKGVPASLLMASLRSALRVYAHFTYDVDRIMVEVNQHMGRDTRSGEFVTAFYGVLTPDGRRLPYCNAGHDPPMLLRNGRIQYLESGGIVLGIDQEAAYERGLLETRPGDLLMLYTDGVVEAMNFADEQFGRRRLEESLRRYADQPAERVARNILWDLRRFRGLADRTDDVTLVVLKFR